MNSVLLPLVCVALLLGGCSPAPNDGLADLADKYGNGLCADLVTFSETDADIGERLESGRATNAAAGMVRWRYEAGSMNYLLEPPSDEVVFAALLVLESVDLNRAVREGPVEYRDAALDIIEIAEASCQVSFENGIDGGESILIFLSRLHSDEGPRSCECKEGSVGRGVRGQKPNSPPPQPAT